MENKTLRLLEDGLFSEPPSFDEICKYYSELPLKADITPKYFVSESTARQLKEVGLFYPTSFEIVGKIKNGN